MGQTAEPPGHKLVDAENHDLVEQKPTPTETSIRGGKPQW